MLRQAGCVARRKSSTVRPTRISARSHSTSSKLNSGASGSRHLNFKLPIAALAGSASAAVLVYSYAKTNPISNEAYPKATSPKVKDSGSAPVIWDDEHLLAIAWGSNKEGLLSPDQPEIDSLRLPSSVPWLKDVALRDLVLHERHGACVDARGDVYQWNAGSKGPSMTLIGKDIVSVQASPTRVFALSLSGRVYTLPSSPNESTGQKQGNSSWNPFSWGSNEGLNNDHVELNMDQKLTRGEKIISISAGNEHLLALTSSGRTFAHPISKNANTHGQLGMRKISLPSSSSSDRVAVDLVPKAITDPYANTARTQRIKRVEADSEKEETVLPELQKTDIHFCDRLFEVPSLKGIKVAQVVAGARSSYVRTAGEGRVLAWGANEYGQLGLGANLTIDTITIPTEIVFSRSTSVGTRSQCIDISTGGDLTFFTVERTDGSFMPSTDLLGCGMGQWGGLGNGMYTTVQGNPSRVRAASGLLEFSEKTQNLQPIVPYAVSVSPSGHVLLTLDTLARAGPGLPEGGGRDLLVWGANRDYQLGNGKRASLATPASLELPGLPGGGGPTIQQGTNAGEKGRFMLLQRRAKEVKDLQGRRWKTNVDVEQCAVAGWGGSLVYWKISRK